jgi:hypothetical protein
VLGLAASDHRLDAPCADEATVRVVVVAAVRNDRVWAATRSADRAASGSINRARARLRAPIFARTWLESQKACSSSPAACSSESRSWCSLSQPRPAATLQGAGSRSSPSRSRARAADAARRSPCAGRTESPAAPPGQESACDPESGSAVPPSAVRARFAPRANPRRSTAQRPSAPLLGLTTDAEASSSEGRVPSLNRVLRA